MAHETPNDHPAEMDEVYDPRNISIEGLDPVDVIKAFYEASVPVGIGKLVAMAKPSGPTTEELKKELDLGLLMDGRRTIEYVRGRPIKIAFASDFSSINARKFDNDFGAGAAGRLIERLKISQV